MRVVKLYLDSSCLSRFFDSPSERIAREVVALTTILETIEAGRWTWIASPFLLDEIEGCREITRRELLRDRVLRSASMVVPDATVFARIQELRAGGLGGFDAAHLAIAEMADVDALLSTDDNFIRKAGPARKLTTTPVVLPDSWLGSMGVP